MNSFQHTSPELRLSYGSASLERLALELDRLECRRALVVCGRSVAEGAELALVRQHLEGRCAAVFAGVRPHSPLPAVEVAAKALADAAADAVVAVGGGSAVVTARAASILFAEGGDVHALCTKRADNGRMTSPRLLAPKLPQFIVPTTPTTAIAKAGSAVHDPDGKHRLALFDPKTRARGIFIHPGMLRSAPVELVLSASLNVLAMAVEGLESASADALADASLMHALRLIAEHLPSLSEAPLDEELRGQLVLAAVLCGQGTDHAGGGICSVLGHAIGARFDVANGTVQAILLPHTMAFNAAATGKRLRKALQALGAASQGATAAAAIAAVKGLLARLPVPTRLRDVGVAREALGDIADEAMRDWFVQMNPRPIEGPGALVDVLQAAW